MEGINNKFVVAPMIWPITQDGALTSAVINMEGYDQADIYIQIGTVTKAGAVTLEKGRVAGTVATALAFERYFSTGFIIEYNRPSVDAPAAVGETVTGAGAGSGVIAQDLGNKLVCYSYNGTTFVDDEVLTFSGGKTARAVGIQKHTDIMVPRPVVADTFNAENLAAKTYCIPVTAAMLGDGFKFVEVNIGDMDATGVAVFAVMSGPRCANTPPLRAVGA